MNPFHKIWRWLRSLGQRRAVKPEVDEELRFHLEQRTAENIAAGMSAVEAAREARKRFGNLQSVREECRDASGASFGDTLLQDIRFGIRMLRNSPGFTFVAVLTLALGIGANTSMFSLLNLLLYRPGPYPDSERLVRIFRTATQSQTWWPHSPADLMNYREQNTTLEHLVTYDWRSFNLAEPGRPAERVEGIFAGADLFPALGLPPALGRVFGPEECQSDHRVAILGYKFWQRRFAADTNIVGRTLRLDGETFRVIGVMPAAFDYPMVWGQIDVLRPLVLTPEKRQNRGSHYLQALGRLKPGISRSQAQAELVAIRSRLPNTGHDSLRLVPLLQSGISDFGQPMLYFAFGLGGFVLLIACANLANLELARGTGRWREMAVRAALGAGRLRLMRQLMTESLLVSFIGGALGVLVAICCNEFLIRHVQFLALHNIHFPLDTRVLGFAAFCALLTGVAFGTAPAWLASRVDLNDALKENHRGTTIGRRQHFLRQGLIVGELALALALLAGAGLFIRSLQNHMRVDPGWRPDGVLTAQMALTSSKYQRDDTLKAQMVSLQQLEDRLKALPGVQSASFSWSLPVWGFKSSHTFHASGHPEPDPAQFPMTYTESVSPSYFNTLGIRLTQGRAFTSADDANSPAVVIINQSIAHRFWPDANPVGKRIDAGGVAGMEIVGVVDDVRFPGNLSEPDTVFQIYRPLLQAPGRFLYVQLRITGASDPVAAALSRAVAELDPELPLFEVQTAHQAVEQALSDESVFSTLLGGFAILGLALAAIGIYGVISYMVNQRTGEIGIRMALGAQRHEVLWLVLRQGIYLSLLGAVLGVFGALGTTRLLAAIIPTMSANEPMIFAVVTAVLIAVALLACYIPARRATKINPMKALRYE
jgi:putative ABC transport system permease protein